MVSGAIPNAIPAADTGNIESAGVQDIYTFTAAAGQQAFFDNQGHLALSGIVWGVVGQTGTKIFETCLGCGNVSEHMLTLGGLIL